MSACHAEDLGSNPGRRVFTSTYHAGAMNFIAKIFAVLNLSCVRIATCDISESQQMFGQANYQSLEQEFYISQAPKLLLDLLDIVFKNYCDCRFGILHHAPHY